jgi:hypothetical protein
LKFIVKIIEVPDIGQPEVSEFAIQAPSHVTAIEEVIAQISEAHIPGQARSVAYIAEKVDRRPEDEPEKIFFIRGNLQVGWQCIDGDETRDATDEEAKALAEQTPGIGCYVVENTKFRKLEGKSSRR